MGVLQVDILGLDLDEFGRVILADDVLDLIEQCTAAMFAGGGTNLLCGGANPSCSNVTCTGSTNGACSNTVQCIGTTNNRCATPNEVPEG